MDSTIDHLTDQLSTLKTSENPLTMLRNHNALFQYNLPSMSSCPMATDGSKYLLIYHHQTLILFELPQFQVIFSFSTLPFFESPISDISFHPYFNCFLLSSSYTLYSLSSNQQLQVFEKYSNIIWSFTHALNRLLICFLFGYSIEQWENGILMKTWLKEDLLESMDLGINSIRCINECLGMTIKEQNFSWRIDLFDLGTMHRIRRGQTIEQQNHLSNWIGILFPIDHFHWLFADGDQGLILIDQTDEHQQKQRNILPLACNISYIRQIPLSIILQTYEGLQFYSLSE